MANENDGHFSGGHQRTPGSEGPHADTQGDDDRCSGRPPIARREFLRRGAWVAASIPAALSADAWARRAEQGGGKPGGASAQDRAAAQGEASSSAGSAPLVQLPFPELEEATLASLTAAFERGELTSEQLTRAYLARIAAADAPPARLAAVIETNPEAVEIAARLDAERRAGRVRGPLHGIPVLLKDNIDTADRMQTTAGSLAILGSRPAADATVAARLREAGAVILGKANLSEWANIRSTRSTSGWSARGGQCRNPYAFARNPCGSSSGSAVGVSAGLCFAALGTETDGSIVCPSHVNGVVGIKPTVGLTSRAGVVPISHSQDTVGPHARTVHDAAVVLSVIAGADPRDSATSASPQTLPVDYTRALDAGGLAGARIGVMRKGFTGYSPHTDAAFEAALAAMRKAGAVLVDPADLATADQMQSGSDEMTVLLYELKADMAAYLATRTSMESAVGATPRTLADLIAFNEAHAAEEMPYFGQELFVQAQEKGPLTEQEYIDALETCRRLARREGIDALMDAQRLDALIAPTGGPAWPTDWVNGDHFLGASSSPAAMAGYPIVNVPMGFAFGLPLGLSFIGRAWSEAVLLRLAYAYEQATLHRKTPRFLPDIQA